MNFVEIFWINPLFIVEFELPEGSQLNGELYIS